MRGGYLDIGSNNAYIGDLGFAVILIRLPSAVSLPAEPSIQPALSAASSGQTVNTGTALPVFVDTDGHLGTVLANANGTRSAAPLRRGKGVQPQAKLQPQS